MKLYQLPAAEIHAELAQVFVHAQLPIPVTENQYVSEFRQKSKLIPRFLLLKGIIFKGLQIKTALNGILLRSLFTLSSPYLSYGSQNVTEDLDRKTNWYTLVKGIIIKRLQIEISHKRKPEPYTGE